MKTLFKNPRGAALITTVIFMGILAVMVASLMTYAYHQRMRSIYSSRSTTRMSCSEAGLQYARAYFTRQNLQWNTMLANPTVYNPVHSYWNTSPSLPNTAAGRTAIAAGDPGLLTDLDNDGKSDVYIYIRDNDDELLPAAPNPRRDNDQNIIIGAMCISSTLVPRRMDGTTDVSLLTIESVLSFNINASTYKSQAAQGSSGTGNIN